MPRPLLESTFGLYLSLLGSIEGGIFSGGAAFIFGYAFCVALFAGVVFGGFFAGLVAPAIVQVCLFFVLDGSEHEFSGHCIDGPALGRGHQFDFCVFRQGDSELEEYGFVFALLRWSDEFGHR